MKSIPGVLYNRFSVVEKDRDEVKANFSKLGVECLFDANGVVSFKIPDPYIPPFIEDDLTEWEKEFIAFLKLPPKSGDSYAFKNYFPISGIYSKK